ncbi:MAG: hypothetical protein ABR922_24730, partial [Streptosporangiaceae bacterium]
MTRPGTPAAALTTTGATSLTREPRPGQQLGARGTPGDEPPRQAGNDRRRTVEMTDGYRRQQESVAVGARERPVL